MSTARGYTVRNLLTFACATFLPVLLGGCAGIPLYKIPDGVTQRASIKLDYSEQSLLSGVLIVSHLDGLPVCGERIANQQKLFVSSRGNPLVSNVNAQGVQISAGEKFMFAATSLQDGWQPPCSLMASFTPSSGQSYKLVFMDRSFREVKNCSVEVVDAALQEDGKDAKRLAPEFRLETCRKTNGTE